MLVVTGKGGVGKTTVAVALATAAASRGRRVLVCETDRSGALAQACGVPRLRYDATPVPGGFSALTIDTESSLAEYVKRYLRIPWVGRIGPVARALDFVAVAAPGVREVLTIGKPCFEVRSKKWDLVIVDAPATGHVVALLDAPRAIQQLTPAGPLASQTGWISDILAQTGAVIVTTPEELPVTETLELLQSLARRTAVTVDAVIVNRLAPEPFTRRDLERFDDLRRSAQPPGVEQVFHAAGLLVAIRRIALTELSRLPVSPPRLVVPEFVGTDSASVVHEVTAAIVADT